MEPLPKRLCKQQVQDLGYILKGGKCWLIHSCKETDCPQDPNPKESPPSMGVLGVCQVRRPWIPGFAEIAKPLYERPERFLWSEANQHSFEALKQALLLGPCPWTT